MHDDICSKPPNDSSKPPNYCSKSPSNCSKSPNDCPNQGKGLNDRMAVVSDIHHFKWIKIRHSFSSFSSFYLMNIRRFW